MRIVTTGNIGIKSNAAKLVLKLRNTVQLNIVVMENQLLVVKIKKLMVAVALARMPIAKILAIRILTSCSVVKMIRLSNKLGMVIV